MRFLRFSVWLLAASFCGQQMWAKSDHPAFLAPGFEFGQIDSICVMPIDAGQDIRPLLDLESLRGLAMETLDRRGYQARSDCSGGTPGGDSHAGNPRWTLTIRVDALLVTGAVLTGSLFDSQVDKEVWKDTKRPGFGGRYKNAWVVSNLGAVDANRLARSALPSLFATFPKR